MGTPLTQEDITEIGDALSRSFSSFGIFAAIQFFLGLAYLPSLPIHTQ